MLNTMGEEVKVLNQRGQLLKASVLPSLSDEAIYKNHFSVNHKHSKAKDAIQEKIVIIHCLRGVSSIKVLKDNPKVMEFLRSNKIIMNKHDWQEDKWDLITLGFLQIYIHLQ